MCHSVGLFFIAANTGMAKQSRAVSPLFFSEAAVKRPMISECGESANSVDDHTDFADFNDDQDNNHLEFSDSGGG